MDKVSIYRSGTLFWEVELDNNSNQSKSIMGENVLNLTFTLSTYVEFKVGDYCDVLGERYKIYSEPQMDKTADNAYAYVLKMNGEGYDLTLAQYLGLGPENQLTESEHYLTGNAATFIDLLMQNVNRVSPGFVKGQVIATGYKDLGFKSENCLAVLSRLAEAFDTEYWIEGRTIHLTKRSQDRGFQLRVGYNLGLYKITRSVADNTRIVTRLYPRGSNKNLPLDYVGTRLHLPLKASHGDDCLISDITWYKSQENIYTYISWKAPQDPAVTSIEMKWGAAGSGTFPYSATFPVSGPGLIALPVANVFDPDAGTIDAKFVSHGGACEGAETDVITIKAGVDNLQPVFPLVPSYYIEKNVDKYGIIEESAVFEDIYPHRTGKVTAIDALDHFKIVDTDIDFNLNDYWEQGMTPQITFLDGQLGGYTFDIFNYDDGTKTIQFLQYKNEQSLSIPNNLLKPAIGDQYVITNIVMPDEYIEKAQQELLDKAKEALTTYAQPQYTIQATPDTKVLKNYQRELFIGDTIWFRDIAMGIDRKIRVVSVIRNLIETYQFQITLSDVVSVGTKDQIFSGISTAQRSTSDLSNQVVTRDIFNGNLVLPPSPGGAGFENVIVEVATNKLFRQA